MICRFVTILLILSLPHFSVAFAQLSDKSDYQLCLDKADRYKRPSGLLPQKVSNDRMLVKIECEENLYLGRPTLAYYFSFDKVILEKKFLNEVDKERDDLFKSRCIDADGTSNRENYRKVFLNATNKRIGEIFISYFECSGAYFDNISGGKGVDNTFRGLIDSSVRLEGNLKEAFKLLKESENRNSEILALANEILQDNKNYQSDAKNDRFMRSMQILSGIGSSGGNASSQQNGGITCFKKREWISGMNKNCVYSCMGSESVQTMKSTDICPLSIVN